MSKVGLFSVGLDTYWTQFESLYSNLNGYHQQIKKRLEKLGAEVIDAGMVDNIDISVRAANLFSRNDVELVFLYVSTYALSSTILPIIQKTKVPFVLLNLQPVQSVDYQKFNALDNYAEKTGVWLEHCQSCAIPEIACVINKTSVRYQIITGYLHEEKVWEEIKNWIDASDIVNALQKNRMGILGNYYGGMLDVYADLTKLSVTFGTHFEMIEMCELKSIRDQVSEKETKEKIGEFHAAFAVDPMCDPRELDRAATTSVALDKMVKSHNLGSLAYYYEGQRGNEYENIITSVIAGNTLLTGKNIPVAGECEVKNAHAMKILSELGAGGSFSEFYLMDFNENILFLGHDGPAHFQISEDRVKLVPLPVYHGKPGAGLSIQMSVKKGPVTLLSVVEGSDSVFLLVAEGESVEGAVLETGNTNSRYRFPVNIRDFINRWSKVGPSHHCAIGTGHHADTIEKVAFLLNIPMINICKEIKN
jgi:L-arabinose isomerase